MYQAALPPKDPGGEAVVMGDLLPPSPPFAGYDNGVWNEVDDVRTSVHAVLIDRQLPPPAKIITASARELSLCGTIVPADRLYL